jgi:hypothetical protein
MSIGQRITQGRHDLVSATERRAGTGPILRGLGSEVPSNGRNALLQTLYFPLTAQRPLLAKWFSLNCQPILFFLMVPRRRPSCLPTEKKRNGENYYGQQQTICWQPPKVATATLGHRCTPVLQRREENPAGHYTAVRVGGPQSEWGPYSNQ